MLVPRDFIKSTAIILTSLALSITMIIPANAAQCATREIIVKQLSSMFREKLHSRGLISEKLLMELYVSKKGSWSILFTSPKGRSCVMATGKMWFEQSVKAKGPKV